jgi:hypothetical protein
MRRLTREEERKGDLLGRMQSWTVEELEQARGNGDWGVAKFRRSGHVLP